MLKFITNISCAFNLAVIFMLTSSLPTNEHSISQNSSINVKTNVTSEMDISMDQFILTLKTKYPKLGSLDELFLNSSATVFLKTCTPNDVLCMAYFDMLLRLAHNIADDSITTIYQKLSENPVDGDSFCSEFKAVLPDVPLYPETNISMKIKNIPICDIKCLLLNEAFHVSVLPLCSMTLSGYQYLIANSNKSSSSTDSTIKQLSKNKLNSTIKELTNNKNVVDNPVVTKIANLAINGTNGTNTVMKVDAPLQNILIDDKSNLNITIPKVPNPIPNDVVLPAAQENVETSPNKPVVTSEVKPSDVKENTSKDKPKSEVNEVKINHEINNIETDTEKKADNEVLNSEVNPNLNTPPIDAAVSPNGEVFIPKSKIFDEETNAASENDDGGDDFNTEDEDGSDPDDELPSHDKSGEPTVVRNNDMLEELKLVPEVEDGKYKKLEENVEQLDPFTEDTDSNFFTYFMFIMVLCVMLYVVYHNKTKMLALVLEGRRGPNGGRGIGRRKHTAAYRKLDSNLEEAITSNTSGRTTQIIY